MELYTEYEEMYHHAACGLITFREDGTILNANNTLQEWMNMSKEEILSKKITDIFLKGKLYYNLFVQPLLHLHGKVSEISFDIRTSAGSFPALFSAANYQKEEADESVINGVIFKTVDRKKFEAEILKEKDQVKKQNAVKEQALLEIAFNQSHLIRAPLANVLGLIALLEDDSELNPQNKNIISMLKLSATNLDEVVREIIGLTLPDED